MADEQPGAFTTVQVTDTTVHALVVGAAVGSSTPADNSGMDVAAVTLKSTTAPSVTTNKLYNVSGALTFNGTAIHTGTGTNGTIAKFTGTTALGNSIITEAATTVTVAGTCAATTFSGSGASLTSVPASALTGIVAATNGGTANAFTAISGPTTSTRTFALPDANATILTSNAAVTVAQGGTSLATLTANNVILGNGTAAPTFVAPSTSGNVLTSNGTTWASSSPAMTLLKAGSGTTSSASAVNVDTFALASTLTALDTLVVYYSIESVTAGTASTILYNSTDSVKIAELSDGGAVPAAGTYWGSVVVRQAQSSATKILGVSQTGDNTSVFTGTGVVAAFATAWTGAWTIAFRVGAVTATGTAKWSWSVYKCAGQ